MFCYVLAGQVSQACRDKPGVAAAAAAAAVSWAESVMMNGSDLTSTTASSPKSKEDQVGNGHDEKENNPFAEYMWMENEEDFNRQPPGQPLEAQGRRAHGRRGFPLARASSSGWC
ncbi:polyadenylate-binding protein-interacting protein 2B isoform X3 [Calypte anna]|uniref:polyadenylate-binding protein-interacting protein 2B isoform X3 n=1 Tax=Calypte anna TaxID=9244 RepID=UPI0011C394AE|nr:polyadenylate-binding protein-interacting protein 2B isoform X3 [Calypte anna]